MQKCTVCFHNQRKDIDMSLIKGVPYRNIARQYGVSTAALTRHKNAHLPTDLVIAKEAQDVADADSLFGELKDLKDRSESILTLCEEKGDHKTALSAIKELRACIELLMKVTGELKAAPRINITVHPQWIKLQAVIFNTLDRFPKAKTALIEAMGRTEDGDE